MEKLSNLPKAPKQVVAKSEQDRKTPISGLAWPTGAALLVSLDPRA